jgi:hypothetical protein
MLKRLVFDLDRGRAYRWVHRLSKIWEKALGQMMVLPERKMESIEQPFSASLSGTLIKQQV